MPIYDYHCHGCDTLQPVFKKIAELDFAELCDICFEPMERRISAPMVVGDYAPYECPITGKTISGRRAHEENLKLHGCRVLEPGETAARARTRVDEDEAFIQLIGDSVDQAVTTLPARKREALAAEMEGGLDAVYSRGTPT